eukprot:SM000043S15860  [mRNA]  locus=s43:559040:559326:- [translate_table: standard]
MEIDLAPAEALKEELKEESSTSIGAFDPSKKKKKKKVRIAEDEEQPDAAKVAESLEAVSCMHS